MANATGKAKRGWRFRLCRGLLAWLLLFAALFYFVYLLPFWGVPFNQSRHGRVPLTPPWALECWLWEDDVNNAARVQELLDGYAKYDLPVRTLLIDSPWSERYNDFKVDESRYPEPEKFFHSLQTQGYRVVLWMTCMVNSFSKDTRVRESRAFHDEARTNGYLAGGGAETRWWKGKGGFIDYSNPDAMRWWHGLQRQVLDWGVDGWKLDGCDTLFHGKLWKLPVPFNRVRSGWMTTRQYMDHYAREEYQHGLSQNLEFVTLIRAMDGPWSHPEGFAPLDAAPVTWVGDNRHTWKLQDEGIEEAIRDILGSARLGYCVIGSDIAGFSGRSNPDDLGPTTAALLASWKPKPGTAAPASLDFGTVADNDGIAPNIYIRWAQFSTFCGLFLNGGHGERRLWKRTPPELEIIRKFSWLHTELVPYMYSHVAACHNGGPPLMRPLAEGKFHYLFGDDFLVAPIHEDKFTRTVHLPPGGWRYLFNDREVLRGPQRLTRDFPLDEYPVFIRDGAIVPLKVTRPYTGLGDQGSADSTTWLIYPNGRSEFTLWHPETHPQPKATTVRVDSGATLKIEFSGDKQPHILRVFAPEMPTGITLDGQDLPEGEAWNYAAADCRIVIKTRDYAQGNYVISRRAE
ncbi:MAG TPA: TIM-barrel domain-containing protein [Verrucomicrobiae bacterium]